LSRSDTEFENSWKPSKGESLYSVKVDLNDTGFALGQYFIIVSSNSSSFLYSVIWYYEESTLTLIDGWPLQNSLSNKASSHLKFSFTGSYWTFCILSARTDKFYPIFIANYSNQTTSHEQVFSKHDYNGHDLFTSFFLAPGTSLHLKVLKYFENDSNFGEFSLYCTSSFHPSLMQLNVMNYVNLPSHLEAWRFEVNSGNFLELQIFLQTCLGQLSVQVSSNWTSEEEPLVVLDEMNDGVIYGKIKTPGDKYFVTVSKKESKSAAFQIVVDSGNRERLYPGNNGIILKEKGKEMKLMWDPLQYLNGTVFNGSIKYRIFYSHDENLEILTTCQLELASAAGKAKIFYNGKERQAIITSDSDDGFYFLVAHVDHHENAVIEDILYTPVKVIITKTKPLSSQWIIIISSLLSITILAILVLVIYKKYRKVDKEFKTMKEEIKNADNTIFEESRIIPIQKSDFRLNK
jgi:hypothetical protein